MTAAPKLIVNADDFGIAEAVNSGIVDAHDRGAGHRAPRIAREEQDDVGDLIS